MQVPLVESSEPSVKMQVVSCCHTKRLFCPPAFKASGLAAVWLDASRQWTFKVSSLASRMKMVDVCTDTWHMRHKEHFLQAIPLDWSELGSQYYKCDTFELICWTEESRSFSSQRLLKSILLSTRNSSTCPPSSARHSWLHFFTTCLHIEYSACTPARGWLNMWLIQHHESIELHKSAADLFLNYRSNCARRRGKFITGAAKLEPGGE